MILTDKNLLKCAGLTILGFASLLAWRLLSPEATRLRKTMPVHTHTVTFTCTKTCTDMTKVPEVFPWK